MSALMIQSWCPGKNDPCDPCKQPEFPVKTSPSGWYGVVLQADQPFATGVIYATVYAGVDGGTAGVPLTPEELSSIIPPGSAIYYVAIERNIAYPGAYGNWIANCITYADAYHAVMAVLANAK